MYRMAPVFDSCSVVPQHLTVEQAHNIVHIHLGCPADQCLRRKAALYFLMDARRVGRGTARGPRRPAPRAPRIV
jgi:hypothetical protein